MAGYKCNHCKKNVFFDPRMGDYVHDCGDMPTSTALATEDVVVMGNWIDYTGTGSAQNVPIQGVTNSLWGTQAATVFNISEHPYTVHGNDATTHRTRAHLEYIDPATYNPPS